MLSTRSLAITYSRSSVLMAWFYSRLSSSSTASVSGGTMKWSSAMVPLCNQASGGFNQSSANRDVFQHRDHKPILVEIDGPSGGLQVEFMMACLLERRQHRLLHSDRGSSRAMLNIRIDEGQQLAAFVPVPWSVGHWKAVWIAAASRITEPDLKHAEVRACTGAHLACVVCWRSVGGEPGAKPEYS